MARQLLLREHTLIFEIFFKILEFLEYFGIRSKRIDQIGINIFDDFSYYEKTIENYIQKKLIQATSSESIKKSHKYTFFFIHFANTRVTYNLVKR